MSSMSSLDFFPEPLPFFEGWELMQTLGRGTFAEVRLAVNTDTKECMAVKILPDHDVNRHRVEQEISVMKRVSHDNIITLFGDGTANNMRYMYLEYADGGSLFDQIKLNIGLQDKKLAHRFFEQLLIGLQFLHARGVVHRDIKPENLLVTKRHVLKISDFGLATVFRYRGRESLLVSGCGSQPYTAPEIYKCELYRAEPTDIWSCGVVLVTMLAGQTPWLAPIARHRSYREWCRRNLSTPPWKQIAPQPLSLLQCILVADPSKRFTLRQVQDHAWLQKPCWAGKPFKCSSLGSIRTASSPLFILPGRGARTTLTFAEYTRELFLALVDGQQGVHSHGPLTLKAYQDMVHRMSHFYTRLSRRRIWQRLAIVAASHGLTACGPCDGSVEVAIRDRRGLPLTAQICLFELSGNLVVLDFRKTIGDKFEFYMLYQKIKECFWNYICPAPALVCD